MLDGIYSVIIILKWNAKQVYSFILSF